MLTMKRAEFTGSGEFASFARRVCGIDAKDDAVTDYKSTADYAKAQDSARGVRDHARIQAAE
jgi:4-hydroxyphenylacetate 3-monooxygenase/chlorophenol-4-monooxygenase component 2